MVRCNHSTAGKLNNISLQTAVDVFLDSTGYGVIIIALLKLSPIQ